MLKSFCSGNAKRQGKHPLALPLFTIHHSLVFCYPKNAASGIAMAASDPFRMARMRPWETGNSASM